LLDPEITKTISDIHESAVKELVQKTNTEIEARDKRITDMEAEMKWRIAQISRSEKQIMAQSDQIQDARALIEDLGGSNVVLMFDTMREVTNDRYM
jgi:chromosome segregation ATPase